MLCDCNECWQNMEEIYTRLYEALNSDDQIDHALYALMFLAGQIIKHSADDEEEAKKYVTGCVKVLEDLTERLMQ